MFNQFIFKLNLFKYNILILIIILSIIWVLNFRLSLISFYYLLKHIESPNYILQNFFTGYYKIHPILFYISFIQLLIYFFNKHFIKLNTMYLLCTIIISFILGSLWALHQFIWGKYWSSDYIEIILILSSILLISFFHKFNFKNYFILFNFIQLILILICLRLNLLYTKHNFFNKKKNIYTNYYIYIIAFIYWLNKINLNKVIFYIKPTHYVSYVVFLIIILNKLNIIIIINLIKTAIFISVYYNLIYIIVLSKKIIQHLVVGLIIIIFINFNLIFLKSLLFSKIYSLENNNIFTYFKYKTKDFFFKKNNFNVIINKISYKLLTYKDFNNIFIYKSKLTKLINYF